MSVDDVEVLFPDYRPFIWLNTNALQRIHHHCGDDDYRGRLFFLSENAWVEIWEVVGPRKNYRSIAKFTKLGLG